MSERTVISLFRAEELPRYDSSRAPALVRLLDERLPGVDDGLWRHWDAYQGEFLAWTREKAPANRAYIEESFA
ncbi:MAG TPA: hypothetical protein ENN88_02810, partial [Candidatus Coatesbacteria bacterium]|nr:hypothetical protein [Candidatus Coatesbacteria bacterium]